MIPPIAGYHHVHDPSAGLFGLQSGTGCSNIPMPSAGNQNSSSPSNPFSGGGAGGGGKQESYSLKSADSAYGGAGVKLEGAYPSGNEVRSGGGAESGSSAEFGGTHPNLAGSSNGSSGIGSSISANTSYHVEALERLDQRHATGKFETNPVPPAWDPTAYYHQQSAAYMHWPGSAYAPNPMTAASLINWPKMQGKFEIFYIKSFIFINN